MTHPSISVSMAPNAPSVSLSRVYIRGGVLAMRAAVADSPQYDLNDRDFALTGYEGSTMLLERMAASSPARCGIKFPHLRHGR